MTDITFTAANREAGHQVIADYAELDYFFSIEFDTDFPGRNIGEIIRVEKSFDD